MDYRLALLLQKFYGLTLSEDDLTALLKPGAITTPDEVLSRLITARAQEFFRARPDWLDVSAQILRDSASYQVRWSYMGQDDYPKLWLEMRIKPILFSYRGPPVWREFPLLAVVGSRSPMSETSRWLQRELSKCLRDNQVGVVSGAARGVDQWGHRLALAAGRPTVYIFPSGLLNPYPNDYQDLWEDVLLQDGCLLSTFNLREPMRKSYFPIRNRWIAGLSRLVFIVEANRRSGTQLTAMCAKQEDREICTLPVSPYSAQGLANLDLLEQGATLIRHAEDLLTALARTVLNSRSYANDSSQTERTPS